MTPHQKAYEVARYWGRYMMEHGTSATLTALPEDEIDAIFQMCQYAWAGGDGKEKLGELASWVCGVIDDIESGIYKPKWKAEEEALKTALTLRHSRQQYVYLLWTSIGIYKIGRTSNPKSRLATYKAMPFQCAWECLIKTKDSIALERELISCFASKVIPPKHEWFKLSSDDVEYIKSLAVQA